MSAITHDIAAKPWNLSTGLVGFGRVWRISPWRSSRACAIQWRHRSPPDAA
ncbi:hypothetical protein [Gloeobacter violaceus]|uniref:hypothetical protein n=1 Tax=Gloeobacter violaceus TaxID=33072 RepID=UPI0013E8AE3B|nr:hypothetical protein [Gloeobacter violaceus]